MGVTPNRGYPYPDPSSPMKITDDLQALAEAYDTDLHNVEDSVQQRPFFRAAGGGKQNYGSGAIAEVSFSTLESNTGGALLASQSTMPRSRFIPQIPGLWMFTATVSYPAWLAISWVRIRLYSTFEVAGCIATEMPPTADGNHTIAVTGVQVMSGTGLGNDIHVLFDTNTAATQALFPLFSRSLTGALLSRT